MSDEDSLEALGLLTQHGFGAFGDSQKYLDWIQQKDRSELRQWTADGRPVACLLRIPTGHYMRGKPVRSMGIGTVTVDAPARGKGYGRGMVGACLDEARAEGYPLSSLFASTFRLYQTLGFERAGTRSELSIETPHLDTPINDVELRELIPEDEREVQALYISFARRNAAQLVRGDELWRRTRAYGHKPTRGVVLFEAGEMTGYLRWVQVHSDPGPFSIELSDYAFRTAAAATRALAFLGSHAMMANKVTWATGPGDPLAAQLSDRYFHIQHWADWMLRILDVPAAFAARGYPAGVDAELHLEVEDDRYEQNCGRWVLRVQGGEASVTRGGDGRLMATVRALAPLFTGHMSATQLELVGGLTGDPMSLGVAGALFAGPSPWLVDAF